MDREFIKVGDKVRIVGGMHCGERGIVREVQDRDNYLVRLMGKTINKWGPFVIHDSELIGCRPGKDSGPWKPGSCYDEDKGWRYFVESLDFTHDVRLYITGDFQDAGQYEDYADFIADKLNALPTPVTDSVSATAPSALDELLPPPVSAAEVKRLRDEGGEGMMTIKARLEHRRTKQMIRQYVATPVPALLAHILERLLGDER